VKRGAAIAELVLGLGIAALGAFMLYETGTIKVPPISKVSPRDIPILVGAILAALGLALAWQSWRAKPTPPLDPPSVMDAPGSLLDAPGTGGDTTDWLPPVAIAVGLIQQILLFEVLGFVPTAAILFFCVAYGFGSRRYLRDAAIAIALAIVAYVGFVHALSLHLPAGILEGVL
jgi:putative tricarboxylic transport membrane protein